MKNNVIEKEGICYYENDKGETCWCSKETMKRVKCEKIGGNIYLTIGKIYDVIDVGDDYYFIKNDFGDEFWYPKSFFTELPELKFPREVMGWDDDKKGAQKIVIFAYNKNLEYPVLAYAFCRKIEDIKESGMGAVPYRNFCEIEEYKKWQEEQQTKVTLNGVPMTIEEALNELKAKQL
jgi:hypothetical protein